MRIALLTPSTQEFTFVSSKDPLRSLAVRVAAKLEEGNFRGAVKIVSSDESFAPVDASTLSKLKEKHPPRHPFLPALPPQTQDRHPKRCLPHRFYLSSDLSQQGLLVDQTAYVPNT